MHSTPASTEVPRLVIEGLTVDYRSRGAAPVQAVADVSLEARSGEIVAIVGESGAGKTSIGAALLDLIDPPGSWSAKRMALDGEAIDYSGPHTRGRDISVIFQDPQTALNPLFTVESQLVHMVSHHLGLDNRQARARAVEMLDEVGIPDPAARVKQYPHQFSGGMRQRVVIALALACRPQLVIADEPTSALDVSVRAQILNLIRQLARDRGMACLLITHDMGAVAQIADRAIVMRDGRIVEDGATQQILSAPTEPYSQMLIASVPPSHHRIERFATPNLNTVEPDAELDAWLRAGPTATRDGEPVAVDNLTKVFGRKGRLFGRGSAQVRAVDNVSFNVQHGQIFGLVGESGSGKSTLAQLVAGLIRPDVGEVRLLKERFASDTPQSQLQNYRRGMAMVFQDPFSSLNRRMSVLEIVSEPMQGMSRRQAAQLVSGLLERVGLPADALARKPHAFSGGQRQRIAIARALAARPSLLICDEPTSALDVSIQAQILNLLKDLRDDLGLTMLFITHDLPVVRQMCDVVGVMNSGKLVECAPTERLFEQPQASYTKTLIDLLPRLPTPQPIA